MYRYSMFSTVSQKMQSEGSKRKHVTGKESQGTRARRNIFYCLFSINIFQPYLLFTPALKNLSPASLAFL